MLLLLPTIKCSTLPIELSRFWTRAGLEPATDYCSNRAELSRFATRVGFEPTTDSGDYFLENNQNLQIKLNSKTSFASAKRILQ